MVENIILKKSGLVLPPVAVGCMRIKDLDKKVVDKLIGTAIELGAIFFDHADIYGDGESERVFSKSVAMKSDMREKIIIQNKCGIIRGGQYNSSYEHIITSVESSLKKLGTDYLDILLIHRPDILCEQEEVAEAFDKLYASGKVRHFGVSNYRSLQIELLQKYVNQPIEINQMQLSLAHSIMMSQGINTNILNDKACDRDGQILDYCKLNDIVVQAWSPFQYGMFEGVFIGSDKYKELNLVMEKLVKKYDATLTAIAIAWIVRHPNKIQPISGTTNPERLTEIIKGASIVLNRSDWYELFCAAGNEIP